MLNSSTTSPRMVMKPHSYNMEKSTNWMVSEDDRILEYLSREGPSSWWEITHVLHFWE